MAFLMEIICQNSKMTYIRAIFQKYEGKALHIVHPNTPLPVQEMEQTFICRFQLFEHYRQYWRVAVRPQ